MKLTEKQIEQKVINVVSTQLGIDHAEVELDSLFKDDLGADSLDLTELSIGFEDEFGLEIPDSDFGELTTAGNVVKYIQKRIG